jgi:hypothetical protein
VNTDKKILSTSIGAGAAAVLLLIVVLVMHMLGNVPPAVGDPAHEEYSEAPVEVAAKGEELPATAVTDPPGHTAESAEPTGGHGDVQNDVGASPVEFADEQPAAPVLEESVAGSAEGQPTGQHTMWGADIDWQFVALVLALAAALVSLATGLKEYLRRQIATEALVSKGVAHE